MAAEGKDLLAEMDVLSAEMERLFYRLFHPKLAMKTLGGPSWQPLTDIYETEDSFVVKMELAGVKKEEVTIELKGGTLRVRGMRRERPAEKIKAYHQMEVNYGRFERVILLRTAISREEIAAYFEDGFLQITIPKADSGKQVARIQILHGKE